MDCYLDEFASVDFKMFMADQSKAMQSYFNGDSCSGLSDMEKFKKWNKEKAASYREEWKKANPGKDIEK